MQARRPQVVIIGGGFGGLAAAKALRDAPVDVTLIDRQNHHLFQPLLYQVATGGLSPANIAVPLRRILRRQRNVRVLLAEVTRIDTSAQRVYFDDRSVAYDYLVVAAGSQSDWFGHDEWQQHAPGLKTIGDATGLRAHILTAFEDAEIASAIDGGPPPPPSFAIIGAGPTGVEMAGAIAELARDTLRHDFRAIDPSTARVTLVEAGPQVLPAYPERLGNRARRALEELGVTVRVATRVVDVEPDAVVVEDAAGARERIEARTVIWAAGVRASGLARALAESAGVETDRGGRVPVEPDLSLKGLPVYVIGDMALARDEEGKPLPGLAPVALQQGEHVAGTILRRARGLPSRPFRYRDRGSMATVGRGFAVFQRGRLQFAGFLGWLGWLFIHLVQVTEFENRVLVLLQWAWSYVTHNRAARLIVPRRRMRATRANEVPATGASLAGSPAAGGEQPTGPLR